MQETAQRTVKVYPARTIRIQALDTVMVDLDLGYGIHAHHALTIEGLDRQMVQPHQHDRAFGCLVVLMGGKRLLVEMDEFQTRCQKNSVIVTRPTSDFSSRVFLDEMVFFSPPGLSKPKGTEQVKLEIGTFFRYFCEEGLDPHLLTAYLNGKIHPKAESRIRR